MSLVGRIASVFRDAFLPDQLPRSPYCAQRCAVFRDAGLQSRYEKDGYVIVDIDNYGLLEQVRKSYQALPPIQQCGFYSSLQIANTEYRRASCEALAPLGTYMIENWLDNYQLLTSSYVCKTPGPSSYVVPHQDWTFVDETRFTALNIWCPLMDVDKSNGALYLLKGSHNLGHTIRGTLTPFAYEQIIGALTFDSLEYIPMKAGEAVIYDMRMIHASPPNTSSGLRVAAGLGAIPAGVQPVHYFQNRVSGHLEKYELSEEFWTHYVFGQNQMPDGTRLLGYDDDYRCPEFTLADIRPLLTKTQVASAEERCARDLSTRW